MHDVNLDGIIIHITSMFYNHLAKTSREREQSFYVWDQGEQENIN